MLSYRPKPSPQSPKAELTGNIVRVMRLHEVGEITNVQAEVIAIAMFEVMLSVDDYTLLSGNIDPRIIYELDFEEKELIGNKNLERYIRIVNGLLRLANNSEIGALRTLDRKVVNDFDIRTAAIAQCSGGGVLLDILCDVVTDELSHRRPKFSVSSLGSRVHVSSLGPIWGAA